MARIYSAMGVPPEAATDHAGASHEEVVSSLKHFCAAVSNGAQPQDAAEMLPPHARLSGAKAAECLRDYDEKYREAAGLEMVKGNVVLGRTGSIELVNSGASGLKGAEQDRFTVANALGALLITLGFSDVIAITMD